MTTILPKTFSGGGYQVTVNADRSILVKQGDWLSKYTMAIWGDFAPAHIAAFKRKVGGSYRDIDNPNLIRTGETLYVRTALPGEPGIGVLPGESTPGGSLPPTGGDPAIPAERVTTFLDWLKRTFNVDPEWEIGDTGGGDLGFSFLNAQYQQIEVINKPGKVSTWFHAVAGGLTFGFPDDIDINGSFSPISFPSEGTILRSPLYNRLTLDDFRHGCLSFELGVGALMGWSASLLFFGMGIPPSRVLNGLRNYFYYGDDSIMRSLLLKGWPSGVMVMDGMNMVPPGAGFSIRVGVMYDRRYWGI
ncbi:MAG: hypothetical protein KIT36_10055 [Alphaproteobacteria bacterium]|nr:hypothetical protein [Alphaproteobacteria bacterium]